MTRAFSELLRAAARLKLNEPVSTLRPSVMMTLSCMILNWLTVRTGIRHAVAAGCSAGESATSPGNSREETPAAHAQPFRAPPAYSFVPARRRLRQLYRQKLCPDLLLRMQQYSTETLALSGYSERENQFYPLNAFPATRNGEEDARRRRRGGTPHRQA